MRTVLAVCVALSIGGCKDQPQEFNGEAMLRNQIYSNAYAQGSRDCERRMQLEAVKVGAAHWEGDREEWFVWNGTAQRFQRIPPPAILLGE